MTVTHDQVQARLTGPGQLFEMDDVSGHGGTVKTWKHAPATLPRNPGGKILKTHLRREVLGS
ncbi:hypothetical protein OG884_31355 [Streptosporangium sp. NBC_01755]|uniref:hypothetical protein n=1 Tax=unclassified Streptosporangium TaxID=2632669 RepID=UPI002DDBEDA7|nr:MULTISPECIES: hypothetical protein [unclassified Streptosporangium]WSA29270.1 hypothetical protein OIE13_16145 [Streptosporangium sp. NBC_01810]WSC99286.1 hypothetical protein OG884_31355 [Streptosporangium sp. NBC_01755]